MGIPLGPHGAVKEIAIKNWQHPDNPSGKPVMGNNNLATTTNSAKNGQPKQVRRVGQSAESICVCRNQVILRKQYVCMEAIWEC